MERQQPRGLPALREDLSLNPGPAARDGSPLWILHDPSRNRFFQIDRLGFEILCRWGAGDPGRIAAGVRDESTLDADPEDVMEMARFLVIHELVQVSGAEGRGLLLSRVLKGRFHTLKFLLEHYLYFRIHLFNPERLLARTYPFIRWAYSPLMVPVILFLGLAGIYLAGRQWNEFTHGLSHFFSLQGLIWFGVATFLVKAVHELGHGYTAYRHGCRVTSMGVVFLVMTPVLYTDASEVWLLTSKKKRMAVGAAGMLAELALAVAATFLWNFLPEGGFRSAALMVATTSWLRTLAVNLMPYMRFDGYYLFSDWLGIANLFDRSFAMGRWWIREKLFGLGDPPPEEWDPHTRNILIAYALGVWGYRLVLFTGIALLVYHYFFKALGIILFFVEFGWFVSLPFIREFRVWYGFRERLSWNRHTKATAWAAGAILALLVLPLSFSVQAPALLRPSEQAVFYAPENSFVQTMSVRQGDRAAKGQVLITLESPELEYRISREQRQAEIMRWQIAATAADLTRQSGRLVAQRELESAESRLDVYLDRRERLVISAAFAGRVEKLSRDLAPGQWVARDTPLLTMLGGGPITGESYISEEDLDRVSAGASCIFYPENPDQPPLAGRVSAVEAVGSDVLDRPVLASVYKGAIPARIAKNGDVVPEKAVYRVFWSPTGKTGLPAGQYRGTLVLRCKPESMLGRLVKRAAGVLIRETGF
ncbi:MAG: HlyD family efflux transporter periplasmic adaptor subunit [Chlorobiaceae bacterium]|nr:HlyD family efflux transporter periplasmic adaptor subunit [Chlorobiaceae bacterium]